jgi:hypothetical protein
MMAKAHNFPLWGAAYVINGGCSRRSPFDDFCATLISRGRQAFEPCLSDPDSLAEDSDESDWFSEGLSVPRSPRAVEAVAGHRPQRRNAGSPAGARWQEGDPRHVVSETQRKVRLIATRVGQPAFRHLLEVSGKKKGAPTCAGAPQRSGHCRVCARNRSCGRDLEGPHPGRTYML